MNNSILVVGGYGAVGRVAARYLARLYPGQIVVAGRRPEAAHEFAESTGGAVRAMQLELDINDLPDPDTYLAGVRTVISSVKRHGDRIVRDCRNRGIHYTEVADSYERISEIVRLREETSGNHPAIVAGVGLIPGLSGILAADLARSVASVGEVNTHDTH